MGYLGKALVGGMMIPLLPISRVVEQAQAQMSDENGAGAEAKGRDLTSCDYWRCCGFDSYLCIRPTARNTSSRTGTAAVRTHATAASATTTRGRCRSTGPLSAPCASATGMDERKFAEALERASAWVARYFERAREFPVLLRVHPGEVTAAMPEEGKGTRPASAHRPSSQLWAI